MTKLLDDAVEAGRHLSPQAQDEIARLVLRLAGTDAEAPVALRDDERAAISRSRAAAARGEFATDEQVRRAWQQRGSRRRPRAAEAACGRAA